MAQATATPRRPSRPKVDKSIWLTLHSPNVASIKAQAVNSELCEQPKSTARPRRPFSDSPVASTSSSRLARTTLLLNSARLSRPTSATRARYMQVESIAFPMQVACLKPSEACLSQPPEKYEMQILHEVDSTAMQMKLHALLEMWDEEQLTFRSPALCCETLFKQATALTSTMPRPNAFVSAVAVTGIFQMGARFAKDIPFLMQMIDDLGTAVYSNYTDLQHLGIHRSAFFYKRGKPWFQDTMRQKMHCESLQNSVTGLQNEVKLLRNNMQEAQCDKLTAVPTAATAHASSQCDTLDDYHTSPVLQRGERSLKSQTDGILKTFAEMSDVDAQHLLSFLLEKAVEREVASLPDILAVTIGVMDEQNRRNFLRECFDYVTQSELHDALQERDDLNDDTRYQGFVENLSKLLAMQAPQEMSNEETDSSASQPLCHSKEARIGKKVHELMALVEHIATEVSIFEPTHRTLFSDSVLERLRSFENPIKSAKKGLTVGHDKTECQCTCGRHILLDDDENKEEDVPFEEPVSLISDDDAKQYRPRRKSTLKRPLSVASGRRRNGISFNPRIDLMRRSSDSLHVFPIADVCHLLSAILHFQFSRDTIELVRAPNATLSFDDQFDLLKKGVGSITFKSLAKDFLTRKYGIKTIAVTHTMQLERSLRHYSTKDCHVRCTLFSWFFGSDTTRTQSKNYAFAFYQKLVKCILTLITTKTKSRSSSIASLSLPISPQLLAYRTLIAMWNEYIGDGEPMKPRTITTLLALETSKQAFPQSMQRTSHFTSFREKLNRPNLGEKTIELEVFLDMAMTAWQLGFDTQMQEVTKTIDGMTGDLDLNGFGQCLLANELDFAEEERYELFDWLTHEGDESVIERKKMLQLVMIVKYLNPV